jgi:hypothetical protein
MLAFGSACLVLGWAIGRRAWKRRQARGRCAEVTRLRQAEPLPACTSEATQEAYAAQLDAIERLPLKRHGVATVLFALLAISSVANIGLDHRVGHFQPLSIMA